MQKLIEIIQVGSQLFNIMLCLCNLRISFQLVIFRLT